MCGSDDFEKLRHEAFAGIERLRSKRLAWEKVFGELMSYQNSGMAAEKAGDLAGAASWYERSISFGESCTSLRINDYFHSVERLAVVYRKLKRYDDEVRVILLGLSHRRDGHVYDTPFARLNQRLERALSLSKNKKK